MVYRRNEITRRINIRYGTGNLFPLGHTCYMDSVSYEKVNGGENAGSERRLFLGFAYRVLN